VILDKFPEAALAVQYAFRTAQNVVAIRQEAGEIGRRACWDIEDVPDV
jgi:hypothetical protein